MCLVDLKFLFSTFETIHRKLIKWPILINRIFCHTISRYISNEPSIIIFLSLCRFLVCRACLKFTTPFYQPSFLHLLLSHTSLFNMILSFLFQVFLGRPLPALSFAINFIALFATWLSFLRTTCPCQPSRQLLTHPYILISNCVHSRLSSHPSQHPHLCCMHYPLIYYFHSNPNSTTVNHLVNLPLSLKGNLGSQVVPKTCRHFIQPALWN